jgi:photosystem I subunit 2
MIKMKLSKMRKTDYISQESYYPEYGGSTSGWLLSSETEEKYLISWRSSLINKTEGPIAMLLNIRQKIFEMPFGGAAIMREGFNLVYAARKEQCLSLGRNLRKIAKIDYRIYRLIPGGFCTFIHPFDGVYPEKVTLGRTAVGKVEFSIGKNPNPASLKFKSSSTLTKTMEVV